MGGTALGASGRSNNGLKLDVKTGKLSLWRLFPTFTFYLPPPPHTHTTTTTITATTAAHQPALPPAPSRLHRGETVRGWFSSAAQQYSFCRQAALLPSTSSTSQLFLLALWRHADLPTGQAPAPHPGLLATSGPGCPAGHPRPGAAGQQHAKGGCSAWHRCDSCRQPNRAATPA